MKVAEPTWGIVLDVPDDKVTVHPKDACAGEHCPFHNPSDHHMKDWEMVMRLDKGALVERVCSHGVGHPDPDSLLYFLSLGQDHQAVHGCDGCCIDDEIRWPKGGPDGSD